jgi:hypothetical protein
MKLLSTIAAIRLDEERDDIENTLSLALVETSKTGAIKDRGLDPLASSTWEMVIYIFVIVLEINISFQINPLTCLHLYD